MPKTTLQPLAHQILFEVDGFTAEMCLEEESLDLAYHLRYQAYFQADAIPHNDEERCTDPYDRQKNARTYLIWHGGRPVASVRSLTWSAEYDWDPTPSVKYFAADVDRHLGIQTPLLESNRYVVAPDFKGRQSLTAQMLLFRIQTLGTLADACDYVITAVRPRHARFYERFMNFEVISDPIEVPEVSFPIQLLSTAAASRDKLAQSSAIAAFEEADLDRYRRCLEQLYAR